MHKKSMRKLQSGQSLVEFALSSVVLLLLISGIVDLGRAFFSMVALNSVISEGAHWAAAYPQCVPTATDTQAGPPECQGTNSILGRMLNENADLDPNRIVALSVVPENPSDWTNGVPNQGATVIFKISYKMNLLTPVIQAMFGDSLLLSTQAKEVVRGFGTPEYPGGPSPQGGVPPVATPGQIAPAQNPSICTDAWATLTWSVPSPTPSGYYLYDAPGTTRLQTITPGTTTSTTVNVGYGNTVSYQMSAFNTDGVNTAESAKVSVTAHCANPQPTALSFFCSGAGSSATFAWHIPNPTDYAIAGYALIRAPGAQDKTFPGASTSVGIYTFNGGADNPASYFIRGVKSDWITPVGLPSNTVSINCPSADAYPPQVQNFQWQGLTCHQGSITLTWNQINTASGYTVYDQSSNVVANFIDNAITNVTLSGSNPSSNSYTVAAFNMVGPLQLYGQPAGPLATHCPALIGPTLGAPLCVLPDESRYTAVQFTWTPFTGDTIVYGYEIFREDGVPRSGVIPVGTGVQQVPLNPASSDNNSRYYLQLVQNSAGSPIGSPSPLSAAPNCPGPQPIQNFAKLTCSTSGSTGYFNFQWTLYNWPATNSFIITNMTKGTTLIVNGGNSTSTTFATPKQSSDFSITAYTGSGGMGSAVTNSTTQLLGINCP